MANQAGRVARVRLGTVRLANLGDVPQILELLTESISQNFRVHCSNDIILLIENSILSICQLDQQKEVIGFLSARDEPLLPSVHPCAWEEYVWAKYKITEMTSRNTLFIHLLCWNPKYGRELIDNMLRTMFMHDAYILHIAMIKSLINYPRTEQTAVLLGSLLRHFFFPAKALGSGEGRAFWGTVLCNFDVRKVLILSPV